MTILPDSDLEFDQEDTSITDTQKFKRGALLKASRIHKKLDDTAIGLEPWPLKQLVTRLFKRS